ncbi:MAG: hypothetical protein Q4D02_05030 [Clostridia bacterium]|nr:hypothetical protein [Clostridia bacterium]
MATLMEKVNILKGVSLEEKSQKKREYRKLCMRHWKEHEAEIISFLSKMESKEGKVFISFMNLEFTPFKDIPIAQEVTFLHDDMRPGVKESIIPYLTCLEIEAELVGRLDFSTCEKSYKKNGVNISLFSNVPEEMNED